MENTPMAKNIVGLTSALYEAGKIKIGKRGEKRKSQNGTEFQAPQKLDYFLITKSSRSQDGNFDIDEDIMSKIKADADGRIRHIPVTLLYNDIDLNMQSRYAQYNGRTLACSGDGCSALQMTQRQGQQAEYKSISCPCTKSEFGYTGKDKCKMTGRFQCLIRGSERIGGVHVFRTTGVNSVRFLKSSMELFQLITRGRIAGLPFDLVVAPKQAVDPQGQPQTIYVVSLEFCGEVAKLKDHTQTLMLEEAKFGINIDRIEATARRIIDASPIPFGEELDEDDKDEFFHEGAAIPELTDLTEVSTTPVTPKESKKTSKEKPQAKVIPETSPVIAPETQATEAAVEPSTSEMPSIDTSDLSDLFGANK